MSRASGGGLLGRTGTFSTILLAFALPEQKLDRGMNQAKLFPKLVHQKTVVGKVYAFGIVGKENKGRRRGPYLGCVVQLQAAALVQGGTCVSVALFRIWLRELVVKVDVYWANTSLMVSRILVSDMPVRAEILRIGA